MPHKDPERRREYNRERYRKNRERQNAYQRAWYAQNKERARATHQVWLEENPDYMSAYLKAYYKRTTANRMWKSYRLRRNEVLELFESSDGLCALCYEVPATVIDHDHDTGRVRGALCRACNVGLGHVERMGASSPAIQEYLSTEWRAA